MAVLISITLFLLGAILASFIGVVVERIYTGHSWLSGRSCCNSCARPLTGIDLIPILSWLIFAGRCRTCRCPIPWLYTISEAVLGTLFVLAYEHIGLTAALGLFLGVLVILAFIVLYDLRHTVVPFGASMALVLLSLGYAYLTAPSVPTFSLTLVVSGIISLFFFMLYALSKGKAMGLGDAPVALALSLVAGHYALPGLLFSFWIGALIGIVILVQRPKGSRMGIEVPFVPFLAAGFLLAFFTQWNPLSLMLW